MTQTPFTSSVTPDINIIALSNDFVFIASLIVIGSQGNVALLGGQGDATVEVYGSVFSAASEAILLGGGFGVGIGNYDLTIGAGGAAVGATQGIVLDAPGNTLTNDGNVTGQVNGVVSLGDQFLLVNSGTITSHTDDAVMSTGVGARIINYGSIRSLSDSAASNGVDISDSDSGSVVTLTNYGTISAVGGTAIQGDQYGHSHISNFGIVQGNVAQGIAADVLRNGGQIIGDVSLGSGNDLLNGVGGTIEGIVHAGGGDDTIFGGVSDNTLRGQGGNDHLYGGNGDDTITGSTGSDTLTGGRGADCFDFNSIAESPSVTVHDVITDFSVAQGDLIDLSGIDADATKAGNQAFTFITGPFHHVSGEMHVFNSGANTIVDGDVNGDGNVDFFILAKGVHDLTADDFIL